ncbi:MAG: MFS transporter [Anaerolineales bacterium]
MRDFVNRLSALPAVRYFEQFRPNARLFLLATVVNGITLSGFQLFFNIYLKSRGLDLDFIGLLNALPSTAALFVGVPMGLLSDRLGHRRAMLIGLLVATAAAWGLISADSRAMMVGMAAIMGVANSLYVLSTAPFMMKVSGERERTLLFSLNWGLLTLSGTVGNLVAGQLPGWFAGWLGVGAESAMAYQAVLLASIAGGGLALLPMWMIREARWPGNRPARPSSWQELRVLVRPHVLRLALPNLLIGFGAATLIPYLALFFKTTFTVSDDRLGLLYSLAALTTGVAALIGPRLAVLLNGKVKTVALTQGASVIFLLIIGFVPSFEIAGAAFLVRGALMNMSNPLYSAFAMEQTAEHERAGVNSVMTLLWELGWAEGPYLSGVVQARYGFAPLFVSTAALYSVAVALAWWFFRDSEKGKRDATSE